jgi:hypothetical protein
MKVFQPENEDKKCAPSKSYDGDAGTCFTLEQLVAMANEYNKSYPDKIDVKSNKKALLQQLVARLSGDCKEQVCLLKKTYVRSLKDRDMLYNTFLPKGPTYRYQWLNTSHINTVMLQYMDVYKDFAFFGALPIDFKEIKVPISFDNYFKVLSKLYKAGKYRLGFVFNLDRHDQPGSHWVSLFADIKQNKVYFFDSAEDHSGRKPDRRILSFMKTISIWCYCNNVMKIEPDTKLCDLAFFNDNKNQIEKHVDVRFNRVQHQRENSECGVYSVNFIIRMLAEGNFDSIVNTPITDKQMNEFRKQIFRFK